MQLTKQQLMDLVIAWEHSYGEDFFMNGPINIETIEKYPVLKQIMDCFNAAKTKVDFEKCTTKAINTLLQVNIDLVTIIKNSIQGPDEDGDRYGGDIEMEEYLNKYFSNK